MVKAILKSYRLLDFAGDAEPAAEIKSAKNGVLLSTDHSSIGAMNRIDNLHAYSDQITAFRNMAIRAAPSEMSDAWLNESRSLLADTERLYEQPSASLRKVERVIIAQTPENDEIRAVRADRSHDIAEAHAIIQSTKKIRRHIERKRTAIIRSAETKLSEPPPELSQAQFLAEEKELLAVVAELARIQVKPQLIDTILSAGFKHAAPWQAAWKSTLAKEPMHAELSELIKLRSLSEAYFGAQAYARLMTHTRHGELAELATLAQSAHTLYPKSAHPRMQPVVSAVEELFNSACSAVKSEIENDLSILSAQTNLLSRHIADRIDQRTVQYAAADQSAANAYHRTLEDRMPRAISDTSESE